LPRLQLCFFFPPQPPSRPRRSCIAELSSRVASTQARRLFVADLALVLAARPGCGQCTALAADSVGTSPSVPAPRSCTRLAAPAKPLARARFPLAVPPARRAVSSLCRQAALRPSPSPPCVRRRSCTRTRRPARLRSVHSSRRRLRRHKSVGSRPSVLHAPRCSREAARPCTVPSGRSAGPLRFLIAPGCFSKSAVRLRRSCTFAARPGRGQCTALAVDCVGPSPSIAAPRSVSSSATAAVSTGRCARRNAPWHSLVRGGECYAWGWGSALPILLTTTRT
jgi:cytochrome c551/c552